MEKNKIKIIRYFPFHRDEHTQIIIICIAWCVERYVQRDYVYNYVLLTNLLFQQKTNVRITGCRKHCVDFRNSSICISWCDERCLMEITVARRFFKLLNDSWNAWTSHACDRRHFLNAVFLFCSLGLLRRIYINRDDVVWCTNTHATNTYNLLHFIC